MFSLCSVVGVRFPRGLHSQMSLKNRTIKRVRRTTMTRLLEIVRKPLE
jgi:hypothetical protein